jgi:hypothetical protein
MHSGRCSKRTKTNERKIEKQTEMEVEKSLVFSMAILQKVPIFQERDAKKLEGVLDDISKKKIENNNTIIT